MWCKNWQILFQTNSYLIAISKDEGWMGCANKGNDSINRKAAVINVSQMLKKCISGYVRVPKALVEWSARTSETSSILLYDLFSKDFLSLMNLSFGYKWCLIPDTLNLCIFLFVVFGIRVSPDSVLVEFISNSFNFSRSFVFFKIFQWHSIFSSHRIVIFLSTRTIFLLDNFLKLCCCFPFFSFLFKFFYLQTSSVVLLSPTVVSWGSPHVVWSPIWPKLWFVATNLSKSNFFV